MTPEILQYLATKVAPLVQGSVLEIGSYNVNGSPRSVLQYAEYYGIDAVPGPGVDTVLEVHRDQIYIEKAFQAVLVCETLEHAKDPVGVAQWAKHHVARNGLLVITSPGYGPQTGSLFKYHAYPKDYWRFTPDTMRDVFFEGMTILDISMLDSNEGPSTTVAGIATLR
jgi:hypothetical protein